MRHACLPLLLALTPAAPLAAQTAVALPHGTGQLTVPANWTVLMTADLAAESRLSDPTDEPARTILLETIRQLQANNRTDENLLLHRPGAGPGQIRLINAYSAPVEVTGEQLRSREAIEQMRDAYEKTLEQPGVRVIFHGQDNPDLFSTGCLSLAYRVEGEALTFTAQLLTVPAGKRTQYFEALHMPDDLDAATAIRGLIGTFDGAGEPPDNVVQNMIIGGIAGALGGMVAAMLSRRRRVRILTRHAAEQPAAPRADGEE